MNLTRLLALSLLVAPTLSHAVGKRYDSLGGQPGTDVAIFTMGSVTYGATKYLTVVNFTVFIETTASATYGSFIVTSKQGGSDGNISGPSWDYITSPIEPIFDDLMLGNGPWSRGCLCGTYSFHMYIDPSPKSPYSDPPVHELRIPSSGTMAINCTA